jgi:hypothetical protein
MRKSMRKVVMPLALSMALIAVSAGPAQAASTRAEYIAQVDPICRSYAGSLHHAEGTYNRSWDRLTKVAGSGTLSEFNQQIKRVIRALSHFSSLHTSLTDRIEEAEAPPEDTGTVEVWIAERRQMANYLWSAGNALGRHKINRFFRQIHRANAAASRGHRTVAGFGFQVCGVTV